MIKIIELYQTCAACPSQWEGKTEDGKRIYVRYRYGWLTVEVDNESIYSEFVGKEEPDEVPSDEYKQWGFSDEKAQQMADSHKLMMQFMKEEGEKFSYDGTMDYRELVRLTNHLIQWP